MSPRALLRVLTPAERVTLGSVTLVLVVLLLRWPFVAGLGLELGRHLLILVLFLAFAWRASRAPQRSAWGTVRPLGALAVMFTLYFTLATVPFEVFPWRADAALFRIDRSLFLGTSPTLWLDGRLTSSMVEGLSFAYAFFIPYVYLSVIVGLLGREREQRDRLFTALVVLYALSFLGYLFLPARGPVVYLAERLTDLPGGAWHERVGAAVAASGGAHGAMPSLHLGVSLLVCTFDLRTQPLRGVIYLPLVVAIALATVGLRYHWVCDLVVAAILVVVALRVSGRLCGAPTPHGGS